MWGKGKAAFTMFAIVCLLLAMNGRSGGILASLTSPGSWQSVVTGSRWLMAFAAILTVVSGLRYIVDGWPLLRPEPAPEIEQLPRVAGDRRS